MHQNALEKVLAKCQRDGTSVYVIVHGKGLDLRLNVIPHNWELGDMLKIYGRNEFEIEISGEWEYDGDWFSAKTPFGTVEISG